MSKDMELRFQILSYLDSCPGGQSRSIMEQPFSTLPNFLDNMRYLKDLNLVDVVFTTRDHSGAILIAAITKAGADHLEALTRQNQTND